MLAGDSTLTDEDIQAAARHWLSKPGWRRVLADRVDDLLPGDLRAWHADLPEKLLEMEAEDPDKWLTRAQARQYEAMCALESAGYGIYDSGLLDRTADALLSLLRERVDQRMQQVFRPEESAIVQPSAATSPEQGTRSVRKGPKLLDQVDNWHAALLTGWGDWKAISPHSANQYQVAVRLFSELIGNRHVGQITREDAKLFRTQLLRLPATLGKGRPVHALKAIEQADKASTVKRMDMKTVKRHVTAMNRYWDWLEHAKHLDADQTSPFTGHSFPGTKSGKSDRDDWTAEQFKRLLTSADYRDAPGGSALRWLPLISLHSGMRLEEICRLRPDHDIITENGVACFHIQPHPDGWDPKTEAGERKVPIHSWLIQHGILNLAAKRRAEGCERLFPELKLDSQWKLGGDFSRYFSRLKTGLGMGNKVVFHSFRHTFRTVLESSDLRERHIDAVMGHEGGNRSEGKTYAKRVLVSKLREVVEAFESPLGLDFLPRPGHEYAMPIKKRRLVKRR